MVISNKPVEELSGPILQAAHCTEPDGPEPETAHTAIDEQVELLFHEVLATRDWESAAKSQSFRVIKPDVPSTF
jgi:hypothetical protein